MREMPTSSPELCITSVARRDTLLAMRSLRLDGDLDEKVRRAAAIRGESVSEFLRRAAAERAEDTLAGTVRERFADVAGVIHGGGGRARRTGDAFRDVLTRPSPKR